MGQKFLAYKKLLYICRKFLTMDKELVRNIIASNKSQKAMADKYLQQNIF